METIHETAHAKINLALHVTGQRADGYHLLETLVAFADYGDRLSLHAAEEDSLTLSGPFAHALPSPGADEGGNLVLAARGRLRRFLEGRGKAAPPVHIHLAKNLPVASGIGGGSADAAAALRALIRHWQADISPDDLNALALPLGADVPMCLVSRPLIARGIGENLTPVSLPALPILLVNPLVPVSTPRIFSLLARKDNPAMPPLDFRKDNALSGIAPLRNDLQPPAETLEPVIAALTAEIAASGARIARMSGSGATCFGLYDSESALEAARIKLQEAHPEWFVIAAQTRI